MKKRIWIITVAFILCTMLAGCSGSDYKKASELFDAGKYAEARTIFAELGDYEDSAAMVLECDYQMAIAHMEAADYQAAQDSFSALGEYKNSADLLTVCSSNLRYIEAEELLESRKFSEAREVYLSLDGFMDCGEKANECLYQMALSKIRASKIDEAVEMMAQIPGYKDADAYVEGHRILQAYTGSYICQCEPDIYEMVTEDYEYWLFEMEFRIGRFFRSMEKIDDSRYKMTFEVTTSKYYIHEDGIGYDIGNGTYEGFFDFVVGDDDPQRRLVFYDEHGTMSGTSGIVYNFYFDGNGSPKLTFGPLDKQGNLIIAETRDFVCYKK